MSDPKQPENLSPAQMRDLADRLERQAQAQIARARQLRGAADTIEAIRAMGPPETNPLTSTRVESTLELDTMEARTRSDASKFNTGIRNAGKARGQTPFGRWLLEQEKAASVWAAEHRNEDGSLRWSPMSVRAWMLPAKSVGARAIPEEAAKLIARESKGAVPATDSSWPSGISRPRRRPS